MLASIKHSVTQWAMEVNGIIRSELVDLDPHEYCIGAVFVIAIGFVLLKR